MGNVHRSFYHHWWNLSTSPRNKQSNVYGRSLHFGFRRYALRFQFDVQRSDMLPVATCATAGPSYVAEMAHPAWRGTLTGLYNTFWYVGGIPATWTVYGTQFIEGDMSWRLPIWLQAVASGLVLCGCLFCPETPRWVRLLNPSGRLIELTEN